jgi:hypothetical protein
MNAFCLGHAGGGGGPFSEKGPSEGHPRPHFRLSSARLGGGLLLRLRCPLARCTDIGIGGAFSRDRIDGLQLLTNEGLWERAKT